MNKINDCCFLLDYLRPAALGGFLGGFVGPYLVEKLKGSKMDTKKLVILETEVQTIEEKLNNLSAKTEERIGALENQLKNLELTISHNTGVLKGHLPNAPLDTPPTT